MTRIERVIDGAPWSVDENCTVRCDGELCFLPDGTVGKTGWEITELETAIALRKEWQAAVEREKLEAQLDTVPPIGHSWKFVPNKSNTFGDGEWYLVMPNGGTFDIVPTKGELLYLRRAAIQNAADELAARANLQANTSKSSNGSVLEPAPISEHECHTCASYGVVAEIDRCKGCIARPGEYPNWRPLTKPEPAKAELPEGYYCNPGTITIDIRHRDGARVTFISNDSDALACEYALAKYKAMVQERPL